MLINLSNHPLNKWSEAQRRAAEGLFGTVVDIPFPTIEPTATLNDVEKTVMDYVQNCILHLKQHTTDKNQAIHIMGEYTFVYLFVKEMEKQKIQCVASTTERMATDNADGTKNTLFQFVQFRPYFEIKKDTL